MRLIWNANAGVSFYEVDCLIIEFYKKYKRKPDVVRLDLESLRSLLGALIRPPILTLDSSKEYADYIVTAVGHVRLALIDSTEEFGFPAMIAELSIDREFEKIVLNEDKQ